jgi:hypothetical protein
VEATASLSKAMFSRQPVGEIAVSLNSRKQPKLVANIGVNLFDFGGFSSNDMSSATTQHILGPARLCRRASRLDCGGLTIFAERTQHDQHSKWLSISAKTWYHKLPMPKRLSHMMVLSREPQF